VARPRAQDYDDKRAAILAGAAKLFAADGFDRTSMNDIAQALGLSKALLYHYYRAKDELLFDVIRAHLGDLVEAVAAADDPYAAPEARFAVMISTIIDCYRDADSNHKVQINHLAHLPADQQAELKGYERRLVEIMSTVVRKLHPRLHPAKIRPMTMTIFGALNWKYMWFRENGPMTHAAYAALLTRLFLAGIRAEPEE